MEPDGAMLGVEWGPRAFAAFFGAWALILLVVAYCAYGQRDRPGARPFVGLVVATAVWTGMAAARMPVTDPALNFALYDIQWLAICFVPVFWFLFAVEYTGYLDFEWRTVVLLSSVPAVVVVLAWTNHWHHLVWSNREIVEITRGAAILKDREPAFWLVILWSYILLGIGSFLLARLAINSEYIYADQSAAMLVGATAPILANIASITDVLIDAEVYTMPVTAMAFGYALYREQLLEIVPATRHIGKRSAVADLEDGLVVVDTEGAVVYCNRAGADILDQDRDAVIGRELETVVDTGDIDFETPDAFAELERDGRYYEVRSSAVRDRHGHEIGSTYVFNDITERKRREQQLRRSRDELRTVNRINTLIRDINKAVVDAESREAIETAVVERIEASDLYAFASVERLGPGRTDEPSAEIPTALVDDHREDIVVDGGRTVERDTDQPVTTEATTDGDAVRHWTTVPLVDGRTAYGTLVLATTRLDAFGDRELAVLDELGEVIGHAINAIERRDLVLSDRRLELTVLCRDEGSFLVASSADLGCRYELDGIVPDGRGACLAYVSVSGCDPEAVVDRAAAHEVIEACRIVTESDDGATLEFTVSETGLFGPLVEAGVNIVGAEAIDGQCELSLEASPSTDVRTLLDRLTERFPATDLQSKRELEGPADIEPPLGEAGLEELTDRQTEVLEAAHHAGYFEWPRESTAEDLAESLDITPPTLHAHLRKAQNRLVTEALPEQ